MVKHMVCLVGFSTGLGRAEHFINFFIKLCIKNSA